MSPFLALAPVFLLFELWQLVMGERYVGLKQIARGTNPRDLKISEGTALIWSMGIVAYWVWMVLMVVNPFGRVQIAALLAINILGFTARRNCQLKWVLVILTFEGALRIGMLLSLCGLIARKIT